MSITYTNRKGVTYHLHQGTTKKGNPRYYFSKKEPATALKTIPDGYEIHEIPNGQVFLRKIQLKLITDQEQAVIKKALNKQPHLDALVDIKKNTITIHTADQNFGPLLKELGPFALKPGLQDVLNRSRTYTPVMRFTLVDEEDRDFIVERFNFRGSIDDWMFLDGDDSLPRLAAKYIPHLGKESFYDLY